MEYSSAAVTGSSGFIGKHLVHALKSSGIDVLEISRSTSSIDVTDWGQAQKIPVQDVVFHLAGITNIQEAFAQPRNVYFTNYVGTLNMLEWCRIHDIEKMVYVSTFVYGVPHYLPVDEVHPIASNNPYSQSKLMGEELCEAYCRDHGLNVTILRLFNIYGPGQTGNFLIPQILSQLQTGEVVLGDPTPKRDFLYISDVVNALVATSISDIDGCNVYNIGSGESYPAGEVADTLADLYFEHTGKNVSIKYTYGKRKSEIADTIANIAKAKKDLQWTPQVDIRAGLLMTLRAYLDEYKE
ncbi:MAG: NAD-dependent epimerase/dehydratase family protein [Methanosarcinales archaeon]|nr:NAD-dependent epimerase/dehydratase family protein [Methanosarcinales archaeon]